MRWMEHPVFFVDFEGSLATGVLEYGVATLLGGRVTATLTRLCAPTGRVRAEDTEVHGLREETLAGCAPFSEDWEVFADLRERGPLAGHYAGAENSLIKSTWPYPRNSPDFARPGSRVIDWGPWIDTGRIYAQLYPGLFRGLGGVRRPEGEGPTGRALRGRREFADQVDLALSPQLAGLRAARQPREVRRVAG